MIGNGNLQLTELTPGQAAWLAQMNSNLQQIDETNPWQRKVTLAETVGAGIVVAYDTTSGKAGIADPAGANGRNRPIGITLVGGDLDDQVRVQTMGPIDYTHGEVPGTEAYLQASGLISTIVTAVKVGFFGESNTMWLRP